MRSSHGWGRPPLRPGLRSGRRVGGLVLGFEIAGEGKRTPREAFLNVRICFAVLPTVFLVPGMVLLMRSPFLVVAKWKKSGPNSKPGAARFDGKRVLML